PVEFLTYSPDGRRLAVSLKGDKADAIDPLTLASDLELRAMPQGTLIRRWRVPGLVRSLSFSPAGDRLAYAGGPAQSIFIPEMANLERAPLELKGQGSTPFDLGFTQDSQTVGFTRARGDLAESPNYEGFNLGRRNTRNLPRDQLRRAMKAYNGWT